MHRLSALLRKSCWPNVVTPNVIWINAEGVQVSHTPGVGPSAQAVFFAVIALVPAIGEGSAGPSTELKEVVQAADRKLGSLEFEQASALLEAAAKNPYYVKAPKHQRAKLYSRLGQVRAELRNFRGMKKAFRKAVTLDHGVRLSSKTTSPKIRKALEQARKEIPPPRPKVAAKKTKKRKRRAKRAKRPTGFETVNLNRAPSVAAQNTPTVLPELEYRLIGEREPHNPVTVELLGTALPIAVELRVFVRSDDDAAYHELTPVLQEGSSIAPGPGLQNHLWLANTELGGHRTFLYAQAIDEKGLVLVQLGDPTKPIELYGESRPEIASIQTLWHARNEAAADSYDNASSTELVAYREEPKEGLKPWQVGAIITGAAAVVGVVMLVVLTNGSESACDAPEGYGCPSVEVVPTGRF